MLSRLLKFTRWLSIPVFIICAAMAVRTAFIWNDYDLFRFGNLPQWHCNIMINLFDAHGDLQLYKPGHLPVFGAGTGPSYYHFVGRGGIYAFSFGSSPAYTTVTHNWYLFGWYTSSLGGVTKRSGYWLNLYCAPFIALLASAVILRHWRWQTVKLRRQRLQGCCPTCEYDLRVHRPGQRCPECGTLIVTSVDLRSTAKPDTGSPKGDR
ncbi:MAG: hypothetical protein FWD53_01710 [Phycisphaerales bacterium]|nr:hypothetical protein [Phycisphaerales bacterium]